MTSRCDARSCTRSTIILLAFSLGSSPSLEANAIYLTLPYHLPPHPALLALPFLPSIAQNLDIRAIKITNNNPFPFLPHRPFAFKKNPLSPISQSRVWGNPPHLFVSFRSFVYLSVFFCQGNFFDGASQGWNFWRFFVMFMFNFFFLIFFLG